MSDRRASSQDSEENDAGDKTGTETGTESESKSESTADEDGEEWQFSLEDIEQREAEATARAEAEERRSEPLRAGEPTLEGAIFVLLGVAIALFVLSRLFVG